MNLGETIISYSQINFDIKYNGISDYWGSILIDMIPNREDITIHPIITHLV